MFVKIGIRMNQWINKNKSKLDIDEILDKINQVGIENLTKEELEFLNNYNK